MTYEMFITYLWNMFFCLKPVAEIQYLQAKSGQGVRMDRCRAGFVQLHLRKVGISIRIDSNWKNEHSWNVFGSVWVV